MPCQECISLGIPEHLCLEGKDLTVPFDDDEVLFRRHNEVLIGDLKNLDLKIIGRIFKLENDSHNRSKLSNETDVLINESGKSFPTYGIVSIPVRNLSKKLEFEYDNGTKKCTIEPRFVPSNCNYAHSELWCYIDGERRVDGKPPNSAKQFFRREILGMMKIIKNADT